MNKAIHVKKVVKITNRRLICISLFFAILAFHEPEQRKQFEVARLSRIDTVPKLLSGFYLATMDETKSKGLKVYNEDKYYYLSPTPVVTIDQVDSVYYEYEIHMQTNVLMFRFNQSGRKALFDFTLKYQGHKVALVLDGKILWAATIDGAMDNLCMAGDYTEHQIDSFRIVADREIKKAKRK